MKVLHSRKETKIILFRKIINYIKYNKFLFIIGFYFLFSTLLLATIKIDICIPCIWKKLFGLNCLGCGLTNSFVCILRINIIDAFNTNPLIFIIIPTSIYFIISDYNKFNKKNIK